MRVSVKQKCFQVVLESVQRGIRMMMMMMMMMIPMMTNAADNVTDVLYRNKTTLQGGLFFQINKNMTVPTNS